MHQEVIDWLLLGDVSIQYQVYRDLLSTHRLDLQLRIENEGWGARFLSKRGPDGHWGLKFYQPKWTSTHYTLLDLKNLNISPRNQEIQNSIIQISRHEKGPDGGINPAGTISQSDVCINGMFLNYASYFMANAEHLKSVVDFILSQHMPDGGFNCRLNRSGAIHSSLHSTLSVLEGIFEYIKNGYTYRLTELRSAMDSGNDFILRHQLFLSDITGEIIHKDFLRLSYPGRWRYDILRAMDYFQDSNTAWDERMRPAMEVLIGKRNKDLLWNLQANHPGKLHFRMERPGSPSRWNTLRAMRVLNCYGMSFEGN